MHVREVVDLYAELQRGREAADDVARAARDDVDAQHLARVRREDDLEQAVLRTRELRTRDVCQRMPDGVELETGATRLLLGETDRAELGIREDRRRHHGIV